MPSALCEANFSSGIAGQFFLGLRETPAPLCFGLQL